MKVITLSNGKETLVDDEDYEFLSRWRWKDANGYAKRTARYGTLAIHREVMGAKPGQIVDHINQNKLDNQKHNLRFVTKAQNAMNSKSFITNTSGVKGVYYEKRDSTWTAHIQINHKSVRLGTFKTREEAADARHIAEQLPD
jgi:hypothetical protein